MCSRKFHLFSVLLFLSFSSACNKSKLDANKTTFEAKSVGAFTDDWTCFIDPGSGSNFDVAQFRVWVPDAKDVSSLRGILVLLHYFNGNSIGIEKRPEWQTYAIENKLAIMTVHLAVDLSNEEEDFYVDARNGSGEALIMALNAITKRNNIPSVANLPFLLKGYSAGGMFSYYFSVYVPERVIAFSNIRGFRLHKTPDVNKQVPCLFLQGELDTAQLTQQEYGVMENIVKEKRKLKGPWAYACEPGADHFSNVEKAEELSRQFFSAALKKRLTPGSNQLIAVSEESGWLGDHHTKKFFFYDAYTGPKNEASWFFDEPIATAWSNFHKK